MNGSEETPQIKKDNNSMLLKLETEIFHSFSLSMVFISDIPRILITTDQYNHRYPSQLVLQEGINISTIKT